MAARRKSAGKKAMFLKAMSKEKSAPPKGGRPMPFGKKSAPSGAANVKAPPSKKGQPPMHPAGKKAAAIASIGKQAKMTPDPAAALGMVPKPSALRGKKKKLAR